MKHGATEPVPPGGVGDDLAIRRLLHELQVHQLELTQQNEELRSTRGELEASLSRRQALFDFAPIALLSLDVEGRLVELNRRGVELLGVGAQPGARLLELVHDESRAVLASALAGGAECAEVVCHTMADDGTGRTADVRLCRPQPCVGEQLVALAESTERHRVERARLAQASAEAANRHKSEFLGRMSHELRTPLNAVLGFADLLADEQAVRGAVRTAAWVAHIQEAGLHLLRLVDDLLDLARLEAGAMRTLRETFDAVALVEEVASMLGPMAAMRPVALSVRCGGRAAWVTADRMRTRQVLINLVGNAIKYGHEGGEVRLEVIAGPDGVGIAVVDDGPGLTAQQQAGLFVPFERLGAERGAVAGVGLGLAIARQMVEAMQGSLELQSVVGEGCRFTVRLPAAPGRAAEAGLDPGRAGAAAPLCVLYVEDNEVNVAVMQAMLLARPHVRLLVARDGQRGLALVRAQHPDLVLLDMQLPDMGGLEFFARLRADPCIGRVACVAVSANALPEELRAALDAGIDGYLTKPLDAGALYALIDGLTPPFAPATAGRTPS